MPKRPVALRKESVDRNFFDIDTGELKIKSLSARRAWIEILAKPSALMLRHSSLSARRAWIEMPVSGLEVAAMRSLSARRAWIEIRVIPGHGGVVVGRSPQGERG